MARRSCHTLRCAHGDAIIRGTSDKKLYDAISYQLGGLSYKMALGMFIAAVHLHLGLSLRLDSVTAESHETAQVRTVILRWHVACVSFIFICLGWVCGVVAGTALAEPSTDWVIWINQVLSGPA